MDKRPRTSLAMRMGFGLVIVLAILALGAPPMGHVHGHLPRFLGRFHPILVHLPIGLLVTVPLLEVAGLFGRRKELRMAAGILLSLATAGVLAAAADGWLLAWSGGYGGPVVTRHMWGGVALAALCLATAQARRARADGSLLALPAYCVLLASVLAVLAWTGHEGSRLTRGDGFLTEYMPARVRAWLRLPLPPKPKPKPPPAAKRTFYAAAIDPIFQRSCVSCHGPDRAKGGLRMDSYEALMRGGDGGTEVEPWYPVDSELLRRVTLPPADDDYMPSNGKNPLTPMQIRLIAQWIAAGASPSEPADAAPQRPFDGGSGEPAGPPALAARR